MESLRADIANSIGKASARHNHESFTKYNVEDGNFRTQKRMNKAQWKSVEGLGLSLYELFYREFKLENGSTLRVFQNRDQVDLVCLMDGAFPQAPEF